DEIGRDGAFAIPVPAVGGEGDATKGGHSVVGLDALNILDAVEDSGADDQASHVFTSSLLFGSIN
ncbi:hypothetical protein C3L57_08530, partial [Veillonellaceae bacterium M2-8]|nr:hypothetical protein [Veillonellaceae bacterium M2-8]